MRFSFVKHLSPFEPRFVSEPTSPKIRQVNQYLLVSKLSTGTNAKVYLAIDSKTKNRYAAKVIKLEKQFGMENNALALEREVRMMRELSHPNTVNLIEALFQRKTRTAYLIMDYADCGNLKNGIMKNDVKLTENNVFSILWQVAKGLNYLHSKKIAHQDIKPSNILIFNGGENYKLSDFGIGHSFQSSDMVFGTPGYQAPEYFDDNAELDPIKEDVWSLGITLYEMLTNELPFIGDSAFEIACKARENELKMPEGISDEMKNLLQNMLQVDSDKRYTVQDVLDVLGKVSHEEMPKFPQVTLNLKTRKLFCKIDAEVCDENFSFNVCEIPHMQKKMIRKLI